MVFQMKWSATNLSKGLDAFGIPEDFEFVTVFIYKLFFVNVIITVSVVTAMMLNKETGIFASWDIDRYMFFGFFV